jgi:hypothetical protein
MSDWSTIARNASAVAAVVALLGSSAAWSQSSPDDPEQALPEDIEEVIVQGQRTLNQLRWDMYTAEDKVFDVFNSLNSDDQYNIECRREAPTGSHIKRRVCKARFVWELYAETSRRMVDEGIYAPDKAKMARREKELRHEMDKVAAGNPQFIEALQELSTAKERFQAQRSQLCEDFKTEC